MNTIHRRAFIQRLGLSAAALPFVMGLPSLGMQASGSTRQRLIIVFTPNGTIPPAFWPEAEGPEFELKEILRPLAAFQDRMLVLNGLCNMVRGDGDSHMRGMSCLLTGMELFPGNIQGGSHTPAGWSKGISIDQQIRNHLQSREVTRTRFGSLEFGVGVPDRADPWTRMSYAGPNKPIAPTADPYQMYRKLYGRLDDQAILHSVLDGVKEDLHRVSRLVSPEDRQLLEEHQALVRDMEKEMAVGGRGDFVVEPPRLEEGVLDRNENVPRLSRMQIDLLVNSLTNDMARVATLQYTKSVGQARMKWLDINDGHHSLSHEPDNAADAQAKLIKINTWFATELAYLVQRLADTPEPGADGSLLDHSLVVWTNELGKGNNHTLNNIPFVLIGNGFGFAMGRSLKFDRVAHNRLLLSLAHAVSHPLETFGNPALCEGGALDLG